MFVPLRHDPGHAQVDFGEALAVIGGMEQKIHFFAMDLPHSDAGFVQAYPAETTEAFCDGHVSAFAFFGGVPASILYDNTKLAVARILGDGTRERTRCSASCSRTICLPTGSGGRARATTKARSRGWSGSPGGTTWFRSRTRPSFDALNEQCWRIAAGGLATGCVAMTRPSANGWRVIWRAFTICQRSPYDACEKQPGRVSSLSLVRYRGTDYSVPTAYGHHEVLIRGYVDRVVISCGDGDYSGGILAAHAGSGGNVQHNRLSLSATAPGSIRSRCGSPWLQVRPDVL